MARELLLLLTTGATGRWTLDESRRVLAPSSGELRRWRLGPQAKSRSARENLGNRPS